MTHHCSALLIALSLFGTAPADAQKSPNFSGRWVLDDPEAAKTGPRKPFCGRECEITQTAAALTVATGTRSTTYKLDGTVERTELTGSRSKIEMSTRAKLEGDALVIITKVGTQPESTLRITLEDGKLAVESDDAGFASPRITLRTLYRRSQ